MLERCSLSKLAAHPAARLFRQLLEMFRFYLVSDVLSCAVFFMVCSCASTAAGANPFDSSVSYMRGSFCRCVLVLFCTFRGLVWCDLKPPQCVLK